MKTVIEVSDVVVKDTYSFAEIRELGGVYTRKFVSGWLYVSIPSADANTANGVIIVDRVGDVVVAITDYDKWAELDDFVKIGVEVTLKFKS